MHSLCLTVLCFPSPPLVPSSTLHQQTRKAGTCQALICCRTHHGVSCHTISIILPYHAICTIKHISSLLIWLMLLHFSSFFCPYFYLYLTFSLVIFVSFVLFIVLLKH